MTTPRAAPSAGAGRHGTKVVTVALNRKPARLHGLGGRARLSRHNSQGDAVNNKVRALDTRRKVSPALDTPTDLSDDAVRELSAKLNEILADAFALYLKTKNFHWHVSGPHFRDYHLLLDEQSEQIFATTDDIAERVRKIGGTTLRSIGQISKLQTIKDNDESFVPARDMFTELRADSVKLVVHMRELHDQCDRYRDVATASLIEVWIDEAERRTWFLFEAGGNDE